MAKKNQTKDAPKAKRQRKAKKPSLLERIFNVQHGVKVIMKTGRNTYHKYNYATERDVLAEIKPLLKEQRLVVLESVKEHVMLGDKKHKVGVEFTIVNLDEQTERLTEVFYGIGEDKEGTVVGLPIAYTMAQKYFAAKHFLLETGDDAEADQNTDAGTDTRTRAKREKEDENPQQATETIIKMLAGSRNAEGIREYLNVRLPKITKLNATQKKEIKEAGEKRLKELETTDGQGKLID